ncbi:OPT superfamily oligopeptide transporter [Trichoderma ceciliae]
MANRETTNANPPEKVITAETAGDATPIVAEADLVTALQQLLQDHELDQNFPQDILERIRDFLDKQKNHDIVADPELARSLLDDCYEQRNLALNHSAYPEVRAVVEPTDDPTLPVATFRVFLLGTIFTVVGTAIQQFFSFRMPAINITTYVIQLLSMPLGVGLAKWLPSRTVTLGKWAFSLNPGRFNEKEHLLIALMANVAFAGYTHGAYIASPIQVLTLDVFYGEKVLSNSATWQITTLIATQMLGYGCAGISRRFLVSPPSMIWPRPLANIALTRALHKDDDSKDAQNAANGWTISRYRFFLFCFWAMFVWYWIPNYIFQPFALFNWPTWFSPSNVKLALIMGSTCGLGLNPLPTLDWNVSTYFGDPIVTPLFTLVNYASGMAFMGFVIAPIVYFKNVWHSGYLPINTNKVYDDSANLYDIRRILNANMTLSEDKYLAYSVPWLSSNQILKLGAFVMIYVAVPMHMLLWHRKQITQSIKSIWDRKTRAEDFNDAHNRLMRAYDECPDWWYLIVLAISFGLACISATAWPTGMPVWGVLLAVFFTLLLQIPIGMLTAITNIELPTSILSLLIGGYALEGKALPNMIFTLYSYMSTSQALNFVADLKMAHYAKIPPRVVFVAQVYATLLAALVAFAVNRWVLVNVEGLCGESQKERFLCPHTHTYFMSSILWGVVGPRRLFGPGGPYRAITYFVPLGIFLPVGVYLAAKRWPRSFWRSVNVPIFLAGPLGWAPYNWSYMQGTLSLALLFNFFIKRRYRAWWERYAYVLTSSFTSAIGISGLVILDWWGNRIGGQGVDRGGYMGADGHAVGCTNLVLPPGDHFA